MNIQFGKIAYILLFAALFLIAGKSSANNNEISNYKYKIVYADGKLCFWDLPGSKPFLRKIDIGGVRSDSQVYVEDYKHPVWGKGETIVIEEKVSGNRNKISLFEKLPFIMLQRVLENRTEKEIKISKDQMIKARLEVSETATDLMTMSTAGLQPVTKQTGSYVYMAIGNPMNYNGIVCGWLTNERGSGIVFSDFNEEEVELCAGIDYGDLRIPAGTCVETETFLIGYSEDIRDGLEKYADAIAGNFNITLPPMPNVYCSWYHAKASNEKKITANSDFVEEELAPYGLGVMQIDDFWQSGIRVNGPARDFSKANPEGPYPNGMKPVADYIKNKGLVPGIWYIPFAGTWNDPEWADKQDLFLKQGKSELNHFKNTVGKTSSEPEYSNGKEPYVARWGGTCLDLTNPKVQEYVRETARRLSKEWGYRYFKMDGLWTGTGSRLQYVNSVYKDDDLGLPERFNPAITPIEAYAKGLDIIREAAGNDVFFLGCSQTQNMRSFGPAMGRVDAMRVGPDNSAKPKALVRGPRFSNRLYFLNKRVWYNDPDPVYVRESFPVEMAKTSVSWTALTGSMHSSSFQYEELPPERLDILKRSLPSHSLKTVRPVDFLESDPARIWLLTDDREKNRRDIIGLFNWDIDSTRNVEYLLNCIGLPEADKYVGFDYWDNKFITPFSDSISAQLPPGGCKIISVKPVAAHPQVISTSRHLTQGVIDLKNENWNKKEKVLSGSSSVIESEEYELRVVVPSGKKSWVIDKVITDGSDKDVKLTFSQSGGNIRILITSPHSGVINWRVYFKHGYISSGSIGHNNGTNGA